MRKRGQRGRAKATLDLIDTCIKIIEERQPITVRGVCYCLFVLKLIPSMAKKHTQRISRVLTGAREDRLIPWDWIVDDSRHMQGWAQYSGLQEFGEEISDLYARDFWSDQGSYPILISEKATVAGILRPVLMEYGVPFLIVHGFNSATMMHDLVKRIAADWRHIVFIYVGDHDPSGLYMSECDMPTRLAEYGAKKGYTLKRIAITRRDGNSLPPFQAEEKRKDPRHRWYVRNHGNRCWELDAMNPNVLRARVEAAIQSYINAGAWERHKLIEAVQMETVRDVVAKMTEMTA
jgi:hypothetical protein